MKRLLVLVAVLVPLSLFIAGCGGSPSSPETKSAETKAMMEKGMKNVMEKMRQGGVDAPQKK